MEVMNALTIMTPKSAYGNLMRTGRQIRECRCCKILLFLVQNCMSSEPINLGEHSIVMQECKFRVALYFDRCSVFRSVNKFSLSEKLFLGYLLSIFLDLSLCIVQ